MEIIRKQEFEKVRLDTLKNGDCFCDNNNVDDFQYFIKTGKCKQETNEILIVCLRDGGAYWEKEDFMVIPVKAKILIEGE